jgi:isoquinoline 1-oxidoreductase subunit alpha
LLAAHARGRDIRLPHDRQVRRRADGDRRLDKYSRLESTESSDQQGESVSQTRNLRINGEARAVDAPGDMPLLWVLRDVLGMTGTKFGCGIAQCGACTVHIDGQPVRSCVLPIAAVEGKAITTIEGVGKSEAGARVQRAWLDLEVVQCGYCQSGQIMAAAALLETTAHPDDSDIDAALAGNICRCGTYVRIREAIKHAATGPKGPA